MPASGISQIVDANVWLALVFSDHVHHTKALEWFADQSDESTSFCRITQMALLRHLTNTKIMGEFVQSQLDAWRIYDTLLNDPRVSFVEEPGDLETVFRGYTQAESPSHRKWTDAYLASFAITTSRRLVTFDKDFRRFDDLEPVIL